MSGGSHNYLCYVEPEEFLRRIATVQEMAERLQVLGYPAEADQVAQFALELDRTLFWIRAMVQKYTKVFHDIEWLDSYDIGRDTFEEAMEKWQADQRKDQL